MFLRPALRALAVALAVAVLAPAAAAFPTFDPGEFELGPVTLQSWTFRGSYTEMTLTAPIENLDGGTFSVVEAEAMTQGSANRRECGLEPTVIFRGATKRPGAPIGRGARRSGGPPRGKPAAGAAVPAGQA